MSAKNYYEKMRKAGLTDDITANDEPDYNQPFYQNIFRLMYGFAQKIGSNSSNEPQKPQFNIGS